MGSNVRSNEALKFIAYIQERIKNNPYPNLPEAVFFEDTARDLLKKSGAKIKHLKKKFAPKIQFLTDFRKSSFLTKMQNFKMLRNRSKIDLWRVNFFFKPPIFF